MVQILMSTYNGDKYIEEQIESILNQTYKNIKILIRDDGSTDNTIKILKEYEKKYPEKIECLFGKNIGVISSFLELINKSNKKIDYFAFCDQDDIWLEKKIEKALEVMKKEIPYMYCSNKILVNEKMEIIKKEQEKKDFNFESSLVENLVTGCTMVVNKKLVDYIRGKKINTQRVIMHDWLLAIIAKLFGEVYYDENSYIYYRQHSNNVVGADVNKVLKYWKKIKKFKEKDNKYKLRNQALEVIDLCSFKNNEDKKNKIEQIFFSKGIMKRYKILRENKLKRYSNLDNFIFKVLYLLDWI